MSCCHCALLTLCIGVVSSLATKQHNTSYVTLIARGYVPPVSAAQAPSNVVFAYI
jgi:hypothetical protein